MKNTSSAVLLAGRISAVGFGLVVMVALFVLLPPRPAHAATFTVNSAADPFGGVCSANFCTLREAIIEANRNPGPDTITFNIPDNPNVPGLEVKTISPTSSLPAITDRVIIDGYTQPGASANTAITNANNAVLKIELSGASTGASAFGLAVSGAGAGGTKIKGLVINRFGDVGVFVNAPNTTIEGNFIGTNPAGDADLGNGADGVQLLSSGNVVGGSANAAQNIISGNGENGVAIKQSGATGNVVSNNHIGTDADAGEDLGNSESGVFVENAPGNTIGGSSTDGTLNIISGNDEHGVEILGSSGVKVLGNLIGVNLNGNGFSNIGNTRDGVLVSSASQVEIGGTLAGQGNTISDNASHGVEIVGSSSTLNKVLGNRIGTNFNGSSAFGNVGTGIRIFDAPGNFVGGTSAGARNVISGNRLDGIFIGGANATDNKVEGNFVGTDRNGTLDLGNGFDGVRVEAPNTIVGGTTAGARNVISGNGSDGVSILGADASGNTVQSNFIGTDVNGSSDLGNVVSGVRVSDAPGNTIGGAVAEAANTIAFNGSDGVLVSGATSTGNKILRNSIFSNGGLGIDLAGGTENANGATQNDPKDPDTGPNNLQNKPVLTSFSGLTIQGNLNSTPNKTFVIRFFANPQGENEGKSFLGQKSVTTNANGNVTFTFTAAAAPIGTQNATATATRAGNTSEFSAPRVAS